MARGRQTGNQRSAGEDGGYSGNYGPSYVNDSPNLQLVGFADDIDDQVTERIPSSRKQRKLERKRQKEARTAGANESVMPGETGFVALGQRGVHGGNGSKGETYGRQHRKRGCLGGFLKVILALMVVLALPVGGYCFLLDRALALDPQVRASVHQQLHHGKPLQPYYALILGSDLRADMEGTGDAGRSDVILLLRVDPTADQVTMVTIPRDTPYRASDGALMKMNETFHVGGPAYTIQAVSELTGVPITHFAQVGYSDLEGIVNALGGVTVDVDTELSYQDALTGDYVTIEPGTQKLDGQQAQIFARARHEYESQDAGRQGNVRALVNACVDGVFDRPMYEVPITVLDVARYIDTDMKSYSIAGTAVPMAMHRGKTTVYTCAGPYDGDINPETGTWMCYENPDAWASLMSVVDSGADPSAQ